MKKHSPIAKAGLTGLLALCAFGSPALKADEFSYSYADLAYFHSDGTNGGAGTGSIEAARNVRVFFGGAFGSNSGVDLSSYTAGLGYIARFNDDVNLIIDVGYVGGEVDTSFFEAKSDDGLIGASLRLRAAPGLEFEPSVGYLFGDTDEVSYGVETRYWLGSNAAFQVGVAGTSGGGDAVFTVGFRLGPQKR